MDDITKTIAGIRDYDYARHTTALLAVEKLIDDTHADPAVRGKIEVELVRMLEAPISLACKQFICQKLWIVGTAASVPVLEAMLAAGDPHVAEAACYALARHTAPAAAEAVRKGLGSAKGSASIAVIDLAGDRRDSECAPKLAELARSPDGPTTDAAIAALGKIASAGAIETLTSLQAAAQEPRRTAAAHALLQGAQELVARGKTAEARGIYRQLAASAEAPWIRRGALSQMQGK